MSATCRFHGCEREARAGWTMCARHYSAGRSTAQDRMAAQSAPIETLAEWHPAGEGVCTGCGSPCVDDLCDDCFNTRWTRVNEPRVCACGNPVDTTLAVRCQDCRDGIGRIDEFLRRAA